MSEPIPPPHPLAAEDVWAVAVTTAQTGPPALAALARYYLHTHPLPTDDTALSEREEQVVRLLARGYSNKEIATKLDVSVKSVDTYRGRAMEKVGAATPVALVRYAARRGWLNPDAPDWV